MKVPNSVQQDIFELVLDFYRSPSDFPELLDASKELPTDITDLLELTAGEVAARSKILTRAAANDSPSELIDATSYFTEQVLFAPGGDHYRLLGLNHGASIEQIRNHYELLVSLFYQEKDENSLQSNEADFSRLNRAYSVLRDDSKRKAYDGTLKDRGVFRGESKPQVEQRNDVTPDKNNIIKQPTKIVEEANQASSLNKASNPDSSYKMANSARQDDKKQNLVSDSNKKNTRSGLPKILIVDDSATVRAGLSLTLNKEFECVTAKDGEKAWKILQSEPEIQLVLTDLDMPELNGYEFIKRVRNSSNENRIKALPVIVVTGTEDINAKQKALTAGADDFLGKSTDYIEVLTRVRVHHKLVEARQKLEEKSNISTGETQFSISQYADDHVDIPVLTKQRNMPSSKVTVIAFGVISLFLVSFVYLTQSQPENEKNSVESTDIKNNPGVETVMTSQVKNQVDNISPGDAGPDKQVVSESIKRPDVGNVKTQVPDKNKPKPGPVAGKKPVKNDNLDKPKKVAKSNANIAKTSDIQRTNKSLAKQKSNSIKSAASGKIKSESNNQAKKINSLNDKKQEVSPSKNLSEVVSKKVIVEKQLHAKEKIDKIPDNISPESKINTAKTEIPANEVVVKTIVKPVDTTLDAPKTISQLKDKEDLASESMSGRIPVPKDVPGVNILGTASVQQSVQKEKATGNENLALLQPDSSIQQLITKRELSLFVFRFIRSYEDGNLFQFMGLFDEFAVTEERTDRGGIAEDYMDLFEKTVARRFTLGDIAWEIDGSKATGKGYFEVQIWPKGSNEYKTFTGELSISVFKKEKGGLVITELFHNF